jgi:hypothetical protein
LTSARGSRPRPRVARVPATPHDTSGTSVPTGAHRCPDVVPAVDGSSGAVGPELDRAVAVAVCCVPGWRSVGRADASGSWRSPAAGHARLTIRAGRRGRAPSSVVGRSPHAPGRLAEQTAHTIPWRGTALPVPAPGAGSGSPAGSPGRSSSSTRRTASPRRSSSDPREADRVSWSASWCEPEALAALGDRSGHVVDAIGPGRRRRPRWP